jgi:hypothetical protein
MKFALRSTSTARLVSRRAVVQRDTGGATTENTSAQAAQAGQQVDVDELVERVYRRWLDDLRLERERGGW